MLHCRKHSALQVLPIARCQDMEALDQQFLRDLDMLLEKRMLQDAIRCLAFCIASVFLIHGCKQLSPRAR